MKTFHCRHWLLVLTLLITPLAFGAAAPYQEGSTVETFSARDQHGVEWSFQPGGDYLLIAFDMSSGKKANEQLDSQGAKFLDANKAVYVSNIFGMPGIGRVFALPKMKKYQHRIILADEKGLLDPFPRQEDRITILKLDAAARITGIHFWDPKKESVIAALAAAGK